MHWNLHPGKTTTETAYYLISTALSSERFNEVVRFHWGVENRLHWRLDVVMNEDQDRTRLGNGPHNLAVLLQIPMHRGHPLRFDRGQATDLMAATIPI
jgi:predicted transposase YbfD/YdcC